ncbi:MAG: MBL fold metallo-hydrolase [Gammaproteobacteria bacterium]
MQKSITRQFKAKALALGLMLGFANGCFTATAAAETDCAARGDWLQVLGAGGPEAADQHASTGYLLWLDGKARLLVDLGGGVPLRFEQSKAKFSDLDAIVFTHLHVDHSAGLPALVKASYFGGRTRDLPVLGPTGNAYLPSVVTFIDRLFSATDGVYPYLSDYIVPGKATYLLKPVNIGVTGDERWAEFKNERLKLSAMRVAHGPLLALAWRVDFGDRAITFSGDTSARSENLARLSANSTLLIAHNAIPEGAQGAARALHMPPSVIGNIAAQAGVGKLVLSHRMTRTFGKESATRAVIEKRYNGPIEFARDLACFPL